MESLKIRTGKVVIEYLAKPKLKPYRRVKLWKNCLDPFEDKDKIVIKKQLVHHK
jgi:hypothetical protein